MLRKANKTTTNIPVIDPTQIDYTASPLSVPHKTAIWLDLFLHQQEEKNKNLNIFQRLFGWLFGKKTRTFKKDVVHTVYLPDPTDPKKQIPKQFQLTHDITYSHMRVKAVKKKIFEYTIIDPEAGKLGQGAWGTVIRVVGILTRRNGPLTFKKNKKFVDKIQENGINISGKGININPVEAARREAKIQKKMRATSKHVIVEKLPFMQFRSHIVDEEFGMSLSKFIQSADFKTLPFTKRLRLTVNLLRELQVVHARGYIHHDIWPNNILIDPETCEVRIIDFGSSKKMDAFFQTGGTKSYAAPEKFSLGREKVDYRADIFSAILTLAIFWGGTGRGPFSFKNDFKRAIQIVTSLIVHGKDLYSLDTVGQNLGVPEEYLDLIKATFESGLAFKPNERAELDYVMNCFEYIRLQTEYPNQPAVHQAYHVASETRAELLKIEKGSASLFGKKYARNVHALIEVQRLLQESIKNIGATPGELNEFIHTLGIKAFQGLTNKDAIHATTNAVITQFLSNTSRLKKLHDHLACKVTLMQRTQTDQKYVTAIKHQLNKIYYIIYKMESHRMRLDDLAKINKHCQKRLSSVEAAIAELEKEQAFKEPTSQHKILNRLVIETGWDDVTRLKNQVRIATRDYVVETCTTDAIAKSDRAASEQRIEDMNRTLDIIDHCPQTIKVEDLQKILKSSLKLVHCGHFGRSAYRDKISKSLNVSHRDQMPGLVV
jgi:serine/threonine protein kinase